METCITIPVRIYRLSISALLVVLIMACEREYYQGPEDQPVYFEYHYINFAWGVADNGWMIDNEGNVRGYDHPEDYRWPDSAGYLSTEDLQYNLSLTDTLIDHIKQKELDRYTGLIAGAADGALSDRTRRGADMGSSMLFCYAYDQNAGSYKQVLLSLSGDHEQFNQSAEGEELVDWLKEFGLVFFHD